jgi:MYXO-CTERM domain-containing protein
VPEIRWCIINEFAGDFACTENPADWTATPLSTSTETAFVYPQYYDGAEFTVQACAMDEAGLYGPIDSVSFTTENLVQTITPAFCGCGVSPTPSERAGWFAILGLVFVGLRRRPGSQVS